MEGEGREKEELLSKLGATAGRLAETETALEETKTSYEATPDNESYGEIVSIFKNIGNELYCRNALLVKHSCSKLRCKKVLTLKLCSYKSFIA